MVEPDRHRRMHPGRRHRIAPETPGLPGFDLAIGQLAGEPLVERHPQREEVAAGIGGVAVVAFPLLGVHVARGAGVQAPGRRRFAPRHRHPQVQHPPLAVVAPVQVAGLDVAVHHTKSVHATQRTRHRQAGMHHFRHVQRTLGREQLLQRVAAVPVEHRVEGARITHFAHTHEALPFALGDTQAEPRLVREHGALLAVARPGLVQRLQGHQRAAGGVARLVEAVHAGVGHQRGDGVAVQHIAHLHARRHGQLAGADLAVLQPHRGQARNLHDYRCDVVLTARSQCRFHQRLTGDLGGCGGQQGPQAIGLEHTMHTIGGEHEGVAEVQLALQVVHAHGVIEADRPGELAAEVGMVECMVLGELLQLPAAQQPGPGIANVGECPGLTLQRQRREGGERRAAFVARTAATLVVVGEPGVLGADQTVKDDRRFPGGRCGMEVLHQAHHRGLRGFASQAACRHTVGDGGDQTPARLVRIGAHDCREILVVFPQSAGAGVANVDIEAHRSALWTKQRPTPFNSNTRFY